VKRHFPDFITAYLEHSRDSWAPDQFHLWMGVSLVGAALERKVWLPIEGRRIYPNLYILLVSQPGIGKSTAINPGLSLIRKVRYRDQAVNTMADQTSEAAFYDQMARQKTFTAGGYEMTQCTGYLALSEASNSLKDMVGGGSIIGSLTQFYDCDPYWSKQTKGSGKQELTNICCNLIAGCTFAHLKDMIPERSLNGGFASRLLYVVIDDKLHRKPQWRDNVDLKEEARLKLQEDLEQIHHLTGPMTADPEFRDNWRAWITKTEDYRQGLKSQKMQQLLARKTSNVEKLAIAYCVSESNDLHLKMRHWERAVERYELLEQKFGRVLTAAYNAEDQASATNSVVQFIAQNPREANLAGIKRHLINQQMDATKADVIVKNLVEAALVSKSSIDPLGSPVYKLLVNPNDHL
jgi:hypothetical protein